MVMAAHTCHLRSQDAEAGELLQFKVGLAHRGRPCLRQTRGTLVIVNDTFNPHQAPFKRCFSGAGKWLWYLD